MEIKVKKRNKKLEQFSIEKINRSAERSCKDLEDVSPSELVLDAKFKLYDGVTTNEIDEALIEAARQKIVKEPNYSYVAARILLNTIYKEIFGEGIDDETFIDEYRVQFIKNLKKLVKADILDKRILNFDLKKIANSLEPSRDELFKYYGAKIIKERYLLKIGNEILETPQAFWMRVAMGLCINEEKSVRDDIAINIYNTYSNFEACASTPTLFNSGTTHSQTASCYLNTFDDSVHGIFQGLWQEALKSKYAGGLGFDVTPWRASGSVIKGTNGESTGLIPWLKIYNDMLIGVNQGGKRPGSGCAYLEPWHLDFMDFVALRKNTGDDRRRTHDMNTAAWIPDEFFFRLEKNQDWYFFCPSECADLHESYGADFSDKYKKYIERADKGEIMFRKSPTKDVWREMLKTLFETSHPWITFKDPCNIRYTNNHEGIVHSSNLCCEITLHTKPTRFNKDGDIKERGETAVCQLSSINIKNHIIDDNIDWKKLSKTVKTLVRAIDNAIDINFYPTKESEKSHLRNRPIGIGIMGYQDLCYALNIIMDSDNSKELAGKIQEFISYNAILASSELSKERGTYETYKGSLWDRGEFPVDSYINFMKYRDNSFAKTKECFETLDWNIVRESVKQYGMRNSNTMAIAPTATISYIQGCLQSIEPAYSVLFTYDNKSGSNFVIDALEFFKKDMKALELWNDKLVSDLYANDGDVSILNIPEFYKKKYARCFDRDMFKLIEVNAERQIWIDQAISFNIYNKTNSTKYLNDVYTSAWKHGLKTTYYLRGMSASKVTKISTREEQKEPKECSLDNPNCESCQ